MESIEELLDTVAEMNPDSSYPTDLKDAIIGIVERCSQPPIILLDRDKCIEILCGEGMTLEGAIEHFDYNVIGSWLGEGTPAFATLIKRE